MSHPMSRAPGGFALLPFLPWIVAAASAVLAAVAWLDDSGGTATIGQERPSQPERTLKLALDTTVSQNAALRAELDRLLTSGRDEDEAAPGGEGPAGATGTADPEHAELTSRIRDAVTRAARSGDPASNKEAANALMDAFRKGAAGYPLVRDAYLAAEDAKARQIMLPTLLFIGQADARDFLIEQLGTETDPELKETLLRQSVRYASPEHAEKLQSTYVETFRASEDPGLRASALRGLRYAKGKEVEETLLSALEDPDEELRITAIANLASRPQMHGRIRELASRETGLVREIAECSLRVNR